jgi:AraC family transcriptional regulator of adaptative response/methylated-DNA-[protein]-cysteine methyltransferase
MPSTDDCRAALASRDARADGTFVYAVKTTGVYCRPSCGARPARPEHVRFFETPTQAESAGFRACKRCRPDRNFASHADIIAVVCRWIDSSCHTPRLAEMAAHAGFSPFHFHRVFKQATGLTPRQYAAARRAERMRTSRTGARSVTDAVYEAGYDSNGTFYAESGRNLGMTPSAFRAGGDRERITYAASPCSLGTVLVARTARGICAITLGDSVETLTAGLRASFPNAAFELADAASLEELAHVVAMVDAPGAAPALPLDIRGTAFQRRVWQALREIPVGTTASYSTIAARIGAPGSARAVARACATNPLAIAIPCHRVVRQDGGLSGYRWGADRKRHLLERESRPASR